MVLEALEASEDFSANLQEYIVMVQKRKKIKSTILAGMAYPSALIGAIYGVLIYFGNSILPSMAEVLPLEKWYGPAATLAFLSQFTQNYSLYFGLFVVGSLLTILLLLPSWSGRGRHYADRLPLFSMYRMYSGLSFLISMSALTRGGMTQVDALDRLYPNANAYIRHRLIKVREQMLNGENLGGALHGTGLDWPDKKMNIKIKIYAETHDLSNKLSELSKIWIDQAQEAIEIKVNAFRSFAMLAVFLGIFVVIGGMYALQDQIGLNAQMQSW
jgi:type II secretory pathway component PulF